VEVHPLFLMLKTIVHDKDFFLWIIIILLKKKKENPCTRRVYKKIKNTKELAAITI
jgi:hypothetical protein